MIGSDLNLTLPDNGETMAENIARIAAALSAIEDSISERATPAALDITAPLDMQGNSLTDVASVQFAGSIHNVAGSIYYYAGDWYVVDAVGTIQLTDGGQLNAGSIGGIKGDYGGINPASVTYVDSSGQYIFTDDTGDYSDLVAQSIILQGASGAVQIGVDAALTGSRVINVKSLPSSGKSLLTYDSATNTIEDNAVTRTTNDVLVTTLNASTSITCPNYKHGDMTLTLHPHSAQSDTSIQRRRDPCEIEFLASGFVTFPIPLKTGDRIKQVLFDCRGNGTADITAADVIITPATSLVADTVIGTTSISNPAFGTWSSTSIDTTDTTLTSGDVAALTIDANAAGIRIGNVRVVYDRP